MIINDEHKAILIHALNDRIEKMEMLNKALPTSLLQGDITKHQDFVYQILAHTPEIEPVKELDQEEFMHIQNTLASMVFARGYLDDASDKLMRMSGRVGVLLGHRVTAIYEELERIELLIAEAYPESVAGDDENE